MNRPHISACLLVLMPLAMDCSAQTGPQDTVAVRLSKTLKDADKPAEFLYVRPSGQDSTESINAALGIFSSLASLSASGRTVEGGLSASVVKETLASKKADTRALGAVMRGYFTLSDATEMKIEGSASAERDEVKDSRAVLYRVQDDIVTRHLKWVGPWGYLKVYPKVGYFVRDLRNVGTDGTTGRYGGPYGAAVATFSLGEVTPEFNFFRRLGLELTAQGVRVSSSSSDAFQKRTETYYEGTLSLALYESEKSAWKPSVGVTRVVGADPIANLPRKVQTAIAFRLAYGL